MVEPVPFLGGRVMLHAGDCREAIKAIADGSIDAVVTDPPYALVSIGKRFGKPGSAPAVHGKDGLYARASAGFMGKSWDTGEVAFDPEFWVEVLRVLKPGGHVAAFGGTRAYHRLACAIEDAGFEIRDQLAWAYGTGFPKNHDVSKGIDKAAGAEREVIASRRAHDIRGGNLMEASQGLQVGAYTIDITAPASQEAKQWDGWGTALKPAWEPIVLARKPLEGTVAEGVLEHGAGALNIDRCRVGSDTRSRSTGSKISENLSMAGANYSREVVGAVKGRWPANILHDGWDLLMVAHPPCTRLCNSGVRWLSVPPPGKSIEQMWAELRDAADLFSAFWNAPIERICVENPIMHRHAKALIVNYIEPAQTVQPWQFGHGETKATSFWLRNLPKLKPTNIVPGREQRVFRMPPGPDRWKERSRTFPGIAAAMAAQWGGDVEAATLQRWMAPFAAAQQLSLFA